MDIYIYRSICTVRERERVTEREGGVREREREREIE
jgi:hypothetical protein